MSEKKESRVKQNMKTQTIGRMELLGTKVGKYVLEEDRWRLRHQLATHVEMSDRQMDT